MHVDKPVVLTYRYCNYFNCPINCSANFCLACLKLNISSCISSVPREISAYNFNISGTWNKIYSMQRVRRGNNLQLTSYLANNTTKTTAATESPTIPMKVATPFKRTYMIKRPCTAKQTDG